MDLQQGKEYWIIKYIFGKRQYARGTYLKSKKTLFGKRHLFLFKVDIINMDYGREYTKTQVVKIKDKEIIKAA